MGNNKIIPITICIDFDGTCVTHEFPLIGRDIGAISVLKKLVDAGHKLVLFTMRSDITDIKNKKTGEDEPGGTYLTDAVNWFNDNGIVLYGVNVNPTQKRWTKSPKAYGQLYIDDAALGCPLLYNEDISQKPFVDWVLVEIYLKESGLIN